MKRTLNTAFYQPNNNTGIPDEDTDNEPAPKRVAPTMHVRDSTPDPIAPAGPSPATPIQALGPISQPLFVSRGQATVPQQAPASTQEKSMSGTNVHLAGEDGQTGLMLATQNGDLLTGKTLLFNGANVNITSLITSMIAALQSQLRTTQALLNAHGVNTDTQNHNGTTALYMAAALGEDDVVKAFIQKGANVNVIANYGWTPLMVAAGRGHLTIVQALLSAPQIDIDAKKIDGATALIVTAALDKDDVVKALIDHRANVNITDNYGWSPLMFAAEKGHLTIMQALLDKNADTKQTNKAGMTVFNIIERKDSNEMKVRLLESVQKYRT